MSAARRQQVREVGAVLRLELAEALRSRWPLFCALVYGLLGAVFILVGLRESTVYGFTGMGRVLLSFCHALVLLLPPLALSTTRQVVNRARDDGTLELLFSHPLSRGGYFLAVTLVRYLVLVLPLGVLLPGLGLLGWIGFGQAVPWAFVGRTLGVCASLLWAFVGLGLLISTAVRSQARAAMYVLLAWALAVALLDFGLIGLMLQWRLHAPTVFFMGSLNPVQAARVALLSGAEPELGTLGPVGFFLATRLGGAGILAVGTLWPLGFGLGCWALARRSFGRGDLV